MFGPLKSGYFVILAMVALFLAVSLAIGDRPPLGYFDFVASRGMVYPWIMPPGLWLCWIGILVTKRRFDRPTRAILRMTRRHKYWLLRGTLLIGLTLPAAKAMSTIKQAIPHVVSFYADPMLARLDRVIFLGADGWQVTHAVLGPLATLVLDRLYLIWFALMMGLIAWYSFTRDQKFQVRGVLSFFLSWSLLGNAVAMALSSVGPCFYPLYYHDNHFQPLLDTLRASDAVYGLTAFRTMDWLYQHQGHDTLGGGISAMPSMHVAIAFLLFLSLRHKLGSHWGTWLAGAYSLAIWIASIQLGWHYATDGLVSMGGVSLIWWAMGRYVDWLEHTAGARPLASSALAQSGANSLLAA